MVNKYKTTTDSLTGQCADCPVRDIMLVEKPPIRTTPCPVRDKIRNKHFLHPTPAVETTNMYFFLTYK
jgi:hypothetical protein